jgi:hypothetical protein
MHGPNAVDFNVKICGTHSYHSVIQRVKLVAGSTEPKLQLLLRDVQEGVGM